MIETICFSRKLDEWFKSKHEQEKPFWDQYALETPPMYFGAHNGAFRIYPAYRSYNCGGFDPSERPWFIGGSSGNKNLLLILDVSGSMIGEKIETMKLAAERIVETLNVGDRIGEYPYSASCNCMKSLWNMFQMQDFIHILITFSIFLYSHYTIFE